MSNLENTARRAEEILNGATPSVAEMGALQDFLAEQEAKARLDRWVWAFNAWSAALLFGAVTFVAFS